MPKSSRLDFPAKDSADNFLMKHAEDNTFAPLNNEEIADLPF